MEVVPRRRVVRRFDFRLGGGDVVEAVPFPAHETGVHVDLLDRGVGDRAVARRRRPSCVSQRTGLKAVMYAMPWGSSAEVVQVGAQAVARAHALDHLVAVVHHHVFALAEAERRARGPSTTSAPRCPS